MSADTAGLLHEAILIGGPVVM